MEPFCGTRKVGNDTTFSTKMGYPDGEVRILKKFNYMTQLEESTFRNRILLFEVPAGTWGEEHIEPAKARTHRIQQTVFVFLVILTTGLQYLVQKMNYKNDLARINMFTTRARVAAWGPKMNPLEGRRKVRKNAYMYMT